MRCEIVRVDRDSSVMETSGSHGEREGKEGRREGVREGNEEEAQRETGQRRSLSSLERKKTLTNLHESSSQRDRVSFCE